MQRISVDGVPVLLHPAPGPLSASLRFHAGIAFADLRTHQVPHLLEHIVIGALPKVRHEVNGTTDDSTLSFEVVGTPDEVRDTLHEICAAIHDLPLGRLDHEAGVVGAEDAGADLSVPGDHATMRFGPNGAGLVGVETVPASETTAEQVETFAKRLLVRGNAVLALTGSLPDGLRLDLPEGPRAEIRTRRRRDLLLPALIRRDHDAVSMSFDGPAGPSAWMVTGLLMERLEESLRHQRGITYAIDNGHLELGEGRIMRVIGTGTTHRHATAIAQEMLDGLRDLADRGPSQEELAQQCEDLARTLRDERAAEDFLHAQADRLLAGEDPLTPEEMLAEAKAVSPESIRLTAREALRTTLLFVPDDEGAEDDRRKAVLGIPDRSFEGNEDEGEAGGTTYSRRLLRRVPRDLRVVIGDEAVSQRYWGVSSRFAWEDIVGIEIEDGTYELFRWDGRSTVIDPRDLRRGDELVERILARAGHLTYRSASDLESSEDAGQAG
ncbi:hypothetical protein [Brachybacterium squillarum]|uniref:hypothetical protein n=1 Tax=Brachybacterium squillarum TaxID=661979 RepID=UPI002221F0B2|nr:hypothetical protein [Brachybacterium squillarum]MCW1804268.1 hypothetical protein [Brachybacterium squillarum]